MFAKCSQNLKRGYFNIGSFALFSMKAVHESKRTYSDLGFIGQVFPKFNKIYIDTLEDWKLAEALYRGLHSEYINNEQK